MRGARVNAQAMSHTPQLACRQLPLATSVGTRLRRIEEHILGALMVGAVILVILVILGGALHRYLLLCAFCTGGGA